MSPASGCALCRSTFSRGESGKEHSIRLSNTEWQSYRGLDHTSAFRWSASRNPLNLEATVAVLYSSGGGGSGGVRVPSWEFRAFLLSVVRWDDRGRVLVGGSPAALTACHREITATCLSVHNADGWPVQHGPARWSCHPCLLSDVSDSWQDTWDTAGRGQSAATCIDIRIYCCQGEECGEGGGGGSIHNLFSIKGSHTLLSQLYIYTLYKFAFNWWTFLSKINPGQFNSAFSLN